MEEKNKKAFTLIELLVVISIIGLLSSIVLVNVNEARKKARDVVRKEDLRTLQTAIEMYAVEYGDYPVPYEGFSGTWDSSVGGDPYNDPQNIWDQESAMQRLVEAGLLSALPVDPLNRVIGTTDLGEAYVYFYAPSTGLPVDYLLCARNLETNRPVHEDNHYYLCSVDGGEGGIEIGASFLFGDFCFCGLGTTPGGSSCPFVYSFDGENYQLDHEAYPFGGTKFLEQTSFDRLKYLKPVNGFYSLRIGERLQEVSSIEGLSFFVVDHPGQESFVLPDINGKLHTIGEEILPSSCKDKDGRDCLSLVSSQDDNPWISYSGKADVNNNSTLEDWIELTFDKNDAKEVKLLLNIKKQKLVTDVGNYLMDGIGNNNFKSYENALLALPSILREKIVNLFWKEKTALSIEVWDGSNWIKQDSLNAGMETWDDFLVNLDLQNIKTSDLKLRLGAITGFYQVDYAAIDYTEDEPMEITELKPSSSILNGTKSVDLSMNDGKYVILNFGDNIDLKYKEIESRPGMKRDYSVAIKGYYNPLNFDNKNIVEVAVGLVELALKLSDPYGFAKMAHSLNK